MFWKELFLFFFIYVIIGGYLWYRRRQRTYETFTRSGIKGPKPSLISGNAYQFKDNPNDTLEDWFEEYGNVFGYFLGERPILVINDVDAIQTILVNKSRVFRDRPKFFLNAKPLISSLLALRGDRWRHVRRVMTPSLSHHKINSLDVKDIVEKSVDICIKRIEEQNGNEVNIEDMMQSVTLDVVCKYALNMYDTDVHQDNSTLRSAAKEYMLSAKNVLVVWAGFLSFLRPILSFINNYVTAGRLTDLLLKHLNKQIQIETQNMRADSENYKPNNVLKSLLRHYWEGKLERDEVTGNAVVLLLAGSDTTATGLTFALYNLAKHKDIQQKLRDEVKSDGYYNQYVDMVWNESLRLCPPVATFVQREASEDVVVNDIPIGKGCIVQIPIWRIHHDPDIWPDPYNFDPSRFAPEYRESRGASFLAFGLGPRNCIGIELAAQEARLTLSKLVDKFEIDMCSSTPDPIRFVCPTDIIYPEQAIYLRFTALK